LTPFWGIRPAPPRPDIPVEQLVAEGADREIRNPVAPDHDGLSWRGYLATIEEDAVTSRLNPYISFNGNARDAMKFYKTVFGGALTVNTFGDFGTKDAAIAKKVMHAMLETDRGFTLMASDLAPGMEHNPGNNITVSLSGDDGDELRGYWKKLSRTGEVTMPLEKQMWGDEFGQCRDKFGVSWMVNITQPQA
jgi:PhnB protein